MKKILSLSILFFVTSLILLSGCSSMSGGSSNNSTNAQMGVLADEVTRLDQALQETRGQLQQEQARVAALESRLGGGGSVGPTSSDSNASAYSSSPSEPYAGIYRTPSGFELPASSVQKALKGAGFYNGDMDGKVGPDTREAVRNFQRANGLTPDGIIGKSTWNLLKKHLDANGG